MCEFLGFRSHLLGPFYVKKSTVNTRRTLRFRHPGLEQVGAGVGLLLGYGLNIRPRGFGGHDVGEPLGVSPSLSDDHLGSQLPNSSSIVGEPPSTEVSRFRSDSSVRRWSYALFALVFVEGTPGKVSAGSGISGPSALVIAHVILGLGIVALAVWVIVATNRFPRRAGRLATEFNAIAMVATAVKWAIFPGT